MIEFNQKPSEDPLVSTSPEDEYDDGSETLMVPPPTLRERIHAAQRARTLQTQPSVEQPEPAPESKDAAE